MNLKSLLNNRTFHHLVDEEKVDVLSNFYDKNYKKMSMDKESFINNAITYMESTKEIDSMKKQRPYYSEVYDDLAERKKIEFIKSAFSPIKIIDSEGNVLAGGSQPEYGQVSDDEMNPFFKGMSNSVFSRTIGNIPQRLDSDNPSLADEALFTLGKAVVDVPVIAGVGAATAAVGAPALLAAGAGFAAYKASDKVSDIVSKKRHGLADYDEMELNPLVEGLKVAPIGFLEGVTAYGAAGVVRGTLGLTSKVLADKALKTGAANAYKHAALALRGGQVTGYIGGELAASEVIGRISARHGGYEFGGRERLLDLITTTTMLGSTRGGLAAGKGASRLIDKHIKGISTRANNLPILDAYVRDLADVEIKSTATDAAKKYFVRGGTPEETAQLTLQKVQELSASENFGHPFRNAEDLANYEKSIYDAARKLDMDNIDVLDINDRGAQLADGTPLKYLGDETSSKSLDRLMELRGQERTLLQEQVSKINKATPKELNEINSKIEAIRNQQREIYETVQKKSKGEIYDLMQREADALDAQRNYIEHDAIVRDFYDADIDYAREGTHRLVTLRDRQVNEMAARTRPPKLGKIAKWYSSTLKTSTRIMDMIMGEQNAAVFKQAFRGADVKRTKTLARMYKHLEVVARELSSTELRGATAYMIRKQMSKKRAVFEDGTKGTELKNVGEKIIKDMVARDLITADELAASHDLNLKQQAYVDTVQSLMRETMEATNMSRRIMNLEEVEGLPDYYPLIRDIEATPYNEALKDTGIGWQEDAPFNKDSGLSLEPSHLKERSARDFERAVSLDGIRTVQSYLGYMINKAYMNPVAAKYHSFGQKMNALHGGGVGNPLIAHAKFLSGDVQPAINRVADTILNKVTTKVSSSMLLYNYSTWFTQLSSIDGIVAECGFKGVAEALGELGLDPKNWRDVKESAASLTAREGGGDVTIVNIQESLTGKVASKIVEKGMYPTMALDMVSATIGYKAFFNKAKRMGLSDFDAKAYADEWVVRTQASSSRIDIAPALRNSVGKNIFALQTFTLNRFDYLVSDLFGAQPVYRFMEKVDDEGVAKAMAKEKGWVYDRMPDGNGYCIYDVNKANNFIEATKKTARLIVAQTLFNMAYDVTEDFTGLPFAKPNPDIVGAFIEEKYGVSMTGKLRGKPEKRSTLSEEERNRRAMVAAIQEFLEIVPVANSIAKYSTSISGPTLSKMIGASQKAQYFLQSGNPVTGMQAINDFTTLFGNPFHAPTAKFLQAIKNHDEERERYERLSKERQQRLKKITSGRKQDSLKILLKKQEKERKKK